MGGCGMGHQEDEAIEQSGQHDFPTRIALSLILTLAFAARLCKIGTLFPIMVDEAIYLRWAEIIKHQHQWFIALLDGKQPLCSWLYLPLLTIDGVDPFLAARVISLLAGVAATLFLFLIAENLAGATAGLIAAALYAVAPYAVFYAHLAYNETLLDLLSTAAVFSALLSFRSIEPSAWRAASAGLWLGAGFLCKTTFLPFFAFPALICLVFSRSRWHLLIVTYVVAAVVPAVLYLSIPKAPLAASSHFFMHQLHYFIDRKTLLGAPFEEARRNLPVALGYLDVYLTPPVVVAAVATWFYLVKERLTLPALMLPFTALILAVEIVVLTYFPSRYQFAYFWPLLVAIACAFGHAARSRRRLLAGFTAVLLAATAARSAAILRNPGRFLHPRDVAHFVTANPYAGYGVREAARYIENLTRTERPLVVLTDQVWGLPTDALFVYLNERNGIEMHEAWWLDISPNFPLLPAGRTALMKSQYERIYGGSIDFRRSGPVLYVTDSLYLSAAEVRRRHPPARQLASFPKPGGTESIDVYRLK